MAKVTDDCERREKHGEQRVLTGVGEAANSKQHRGLNRTDKPEHCNCVQDTSNEPVQKRCHICDTPGFLQANRQNVAEYPLKRTAQSSQ